MNRVCCGAVNSFVDFPHGSGGSHGDNQPLPVAVFKMNTTTSCGWFQTNPQNQWDLQGKYHGVWNSSRWFCKIYCGKAERVGLIFNTRQETIFVSYIVMFAEKTYNAFEPVGHTKRRKERES